MPAFSAVPNGRHNRIEEFTIASGETYTNGAILLLDSGEDVAEVGADPTALLGIALGSAAAGVGNHVDPTLQLVCIAEEMTTFIMSGDNDPVKADINQDYGVVADGDGIWTVDGTETTALVVHVLNIDLLRNLYIIKFLATVLQTTEAV